MKFSEAIEKVKDTGGIIGIKHWNFRVAVTNLKNPMILLDEKNQPLKNKDYKPNSFKSKWVLWDANPKFILDDDWFVEKTFSKQEKGYFYKYL